MRKRLIHGPAVRAVLRARYVELWNRFGARSVLDWLVFADQLEEAGLDVAGRQLQTLNARTARLERTYSRAHGLDEGWAAEADRRYWRWMRANRRLSVAWLRWRRSIHRALGIRRKVY